MVDVRAGMKTWIAGLGLALISAPAIGFDCPGDMVAVAKPGHFGARTLHDYRELVLLQTRHQDDELLSNVKSGDLVRLPAGRKVCIRDSSQHSYRTLVTVSGLDGTYWVHLNALDWGW